MLSSQSKVSVLHLFLQIHKTIVLTFIQDLFIALSAIVIHFNANELDYFHFCCCEYLLSIFSQIRNTVIINTENFTMV